MDAHFREGGHRQTFLRLYYVKAHNAYATQSGPCLGSVLERFPRGCSLRGRNLSSISVKRSHGGEGVLLTSVYTMWQTHPSDVDKEISIVNPSS